jgi:uncharacterized protein (UPF0332 family)
MNKYEKLVKTGRIREVRISEAEIKRSIEKAENDLKTGTKLMEEDLDWGFAVIYNAALQASKAYMFSQGYRSGSTQGYKNTFAFMLLALGKDYRNLITYFDRMRNKRNRAIYDACGLITETEARNLLKQATKFVALIKKLLERKG